MKGFVQGGKTDFFALLLLDLVLAEGFFLRHGLSWQGAKIIKGGASTIENGCKVQGAAKGSCGG